jgi:hypothetical protein
MHFKVPLFSSQKMAAAAYLQITSVHWMLNHTNTTNPTEPQPLFLAKDH